MDVIEAIRSRKSIRGYKTDPVPKEVLKQILEIATCAPSAENGQPWEFTVITGEVLDKIGQANVERYNSREISGQSAPRGSRTGKFRERQIALAIQLFQLMNIGREEREKRTDWMRRHYRYFDAPAVIIISTDESLGDAHRYDIGAVVQTIALAALNYGLGTCISLTGVRYPDLIKKFTGIPESKQINICLTVGYPDWDFPANKVRSEREPIENITTWCGI